MSAGGVAAPNRDALALAALEEVRPDTIVAVGAGQTAARFIRALAEHYRSELEHGRDLGIRCVAASNSSESLARDLGLPMTEFAVVEKVDLFIDGADEVDRRMNVIKGTRGTMARERMLAWASRRVVYMVRASKVSERVGESSTLAIAVMAFGLESIRAALRNIGVTGVVRRTMNGELFITDNGNLVLDVDLHGDEDLGELHATLNDIPGVIDHGLFLTEADAILIEHEDGRIERLDR